MRSERWATPDEIEKELKPEAAGPVLYCNKGKKFTHEGEGHVMILGVTGSGKSRRQTIPMAMSFIENRQSAVIADAKGEIYAHTKSMIPDCYDVHVIDFRNLYQSDAEGWNPLYAPYTLWKTNTPKNRHIAEQMIEELAHTMYPEVKSSDPFWIKEARNVFLAAAYSLFEFAEPEQVNLASIYYLISKGEERYAASTYLKVFSELIQENENVAMQLQSYLTTANDTRGGIRSTFLDGLSIATKSMSIRNFLSHDDLHINELKGDKPTLIYIIIPDETPIYDELTGVLISQLMNHYVRIAEQKYAGKLPIRVNFLLEELGNIGHSIVNLPHIMSAGRSRNIRVEFVLQSISQLVDIYGESKASTIISNCDVRIAFRMNNWDTLTEMSRICGEREINHDGHITREPLITQSQLAAMQTGQALVIISGHMKFITWLPDFSEMCFLDRNLQARQKCRVPVTHKTNYFDIKKFVTERKKTEFLASMDEEKAESLSFGAFHILGNNENNNHPKTNRDEMIQSIDKKSAELDEEKLNTQKTKTVRILSIIDKKKTAVVIRKICKISGDALRKAIFEAKQGTYTVANMKATDAERFVRELQKVGAFAICFDSDDAGMFD